MKKKWVMVKGEILTRKNDNILDYSELQKQIKAYKAMWGELKQIKLIIQRYSHQLELFRLETDAELFVRVKKTKGKIALLQHQLMEE